MVHTPYQQFTDSMNSLVMRVNKLTTSTMNTHSFIETQFTKIDEKVNDTFIKVSSIITAWLKNLKPSVIPDVDPRNVFDIPILLEFLNEDENIDTIGEYDSELYNKITAHNMKCLRHIKYYKEYEERMLKFYETKLLKATDYISKNKFYVEELTNLTDRLKEVHTSIRVFDCMTENLINLEMLENEFDSLSKSIETIIHIINCNLHKAHTVLPTSFDFNDPFYYVLQCLNSPYHNKKIDEMTTQRISLIYEIATVKSQV
jgi:hypothetical protein